MRRLWSKRRLAYLFSGLIIFLLSVGIMVGGGHVLGFSTMTVGSFFMYASRKLLRE